MRNCLMQTLYINKDAKLEREGATLLVRTADAPKRRVPIDGLAHVVLAGEAGITTSLIGLFGRAGVRVTVLDWHGNVTGCFEPAESPRSGKVHLVQAACALDPVQSMTLARAFVSGAISNMVANLRYRTYRGNVALVAGVDKLKAIAARLDGAADRTALMGYEGSARACYYESWSLIDPRLTFVPRRRRPPNNRINCLISWFNGLAYAMTRNEIAKTHLDQSVSFLHAPGEARHSLALDISEIFKPSICDALIFELVLRGRLDDCWFHEEEPGVCRLSETGRRQTLEAWTTRTESRLAEEVGQDRHRPSMRELILAEALAVERHGLGIAPYRSWRRKV
jgi:CRISPR-associated protein Cas1